MRGTLRVTLASIDYGAGELTAEVNVNGFSGVSSAWFGTDRLLAFAAELEKTFPFTRDRPIVLQGGVWNSKQNCIEEVHVGLSFYPFGLRGAVTCQVDLNAAAQPEFGNSNKRRPSLLSCDIVTTYEDVREFSRQMIALANGEGGNAILRENES
jgi:hypothetical protein